MAVLEMYIFADKNIGAASSMLLDRFPEPLIIPDEDNVKQAANPLSITCSEVFSKRFEVIKAINISFHECMDAINFSKINEPFSIAYQVAKERAYMLRSTMRDFFSNALSSSSSSKSVSLIISRSKAIKFKSRGICDVDGTFSCFGQAFRTLHGLSPSGFRSSDQLWKVSFAGEYGTDAGGLYRESWTEFAQELMSIHLPLLRPVPNAIDIHGQNRETWVLNPDATSPGQIQMFEFLGKLMGMSVRGDLSMDLFLNPMVWKMIVGLPVSLEDYKGVNELEYNRIKAREGSQYNVDESEPIGWKFTAYSLGGTLIELHRHGSFEDVTRGNVSRYYDELTQYRLTEMSIVAAAVRRGLMTILPPIMINFISGKDLETRVCGSPNIDIDLLKSATETCESGYSESSQVVVWFWEVLQEFSQIDRKAYLRFIWGRNRLPLTRAGFAQKMKITKLSCRQPDRFLPVSHTCFFKIDLPNYSSKEILRQKLLYAIHNCSSIDGDNNTSAAQLGMESDM